MSESQASDSLTAKFLIAMPGMQDPRFAHALVLMCEHSAKGAMGLIINKPIPALSVSEVLKPMGLGPDCGSLAHTPYFGGPVESGRGFVLHSPDYQASAGTHAIHDFAAMTTTPEILVDLSQNKGPEKAILALGYSGASWTDAAHAAGFADSAHLSRTSRTMFGTTPSALQMSGPLSRLERNLPY